MEINETWISEHGAEVKIISITETTVFCESDFFAFVYPVEKETFLVSMKLKEKRDE